MPELPEAGRCPRCKAKLPADAPDGQCPSCLLAAGLPLSADDHAEQTGTPQIPRYRIIRLIGVGGMGEVYEAEQDQPRRSIALKVIRAGLATRELLRRFAQEAETLGRLQHPNIAQIYESGTAGSGSRLQPYFAMELVCGPDESKAPTITVYAERQHLSARERLKLFAEVADAVHFAHQKGIIHRDLKPANLLVNASGQPKILDFGIARLADSDIDITTAHTDIGQVIGTLPYMSPEQAGGETAQLDTRSDVYALGVICYELLAGRLPYSFKSRMIHEAVRVIREEEPTRLDSINRAFRGDVVTIVAKALEKEKERRYQSAAEMASDIRRFLDDQPIAAHRPSATYQLRKFAKRNKALVAGVGGVIIALILGLIGTGIGLMSARHERDSARVARDAEGVQREAATRSQKLAEEQGALAQRRLSQSLLVTGASLLQTGDAAGARTSYWEALRVAHDIHVPDLAARSGLMTTYVAMPPPLVGWDGKRDGVGGFKGNVTVAVNVLFTPDQRQIVTTGSDGYIQVWDVRTGVRIASAIACNKAVCALAISPDGKVLATGGDDSRIKLWDLATLRQLATLSGHSNTVRTLVFTANGAQLISCSWDKSIRVWDVSTGEGIATLLGHQGLIQDVAITRDGKRLFSVCEDGEIKVWDLETKRALKSLSEPCRFARSSIALSPDQRFAIVGTVEAVQLWDLQSGTLARYLKGHPAGVRKVAISPDGRLAASGGIEGSIRVWNMSDGSEVRCFTGYRGSIESLTFSPDGMLIVSGADDGSLRLWEVDGRGEQRTFEWHTDRISDIALSSDGQTALSGSFDGTLALWDLATGVRLRSMAPGIGAIWSVALFSDGRRALIAGEDKSVRIVDVISSRELLSLRGHTDVVTDAVLSGDERFVASASCDGSIKLWDLQSAAEPRTFTGHQGKVRAVALSADGGTIVSAGHDRTVKVWDASSGKELRSLAGHHHWVQGVGLSPDHSKALSWSWDHTAATWDIASGKKIRTLIGATSFLYSGGWSGDGEFIVVGSQEGRLWFWDRQNSESVCNFRGHADTVSALVTMPDNARILSADRVMRLWDLSRADEHHLFAQTIPPARRAIEENPNDASALAAFGAWYTFRGRDDWAADFLEKSRAAGGAVSPLALGRCYWRLNRLEDAAREFHAARDRGEAPSPYLDLCLDAIASARASARPATSTPSPSASTTLQLNMPASFTREPIRR